jgi:hypothetical protein
MNFKQPDNLVYFAPSNKESGIGGRTGLDQTRYNVGAGGISQKGQFPDIIVYNFMGNVLGPKSDKNSALTRKKPWNIVEQYMSFIGSRWCVPEKGTAAHAETSDGFTFFLFLF